jgi:hypothetical protein
MTYIKVWKVAQWSMIVLEEEHNYLQLGSHLDHEGNQKLKVIKKGCCPHQKQRQLGLEKDRRMKGRQVDLVELDKTKLQ